ncbi:MAG: M61 family peptidase [Bacteroidota bacterium]|nr:M61 family peptidase [Bacteroidota bacterium]
MIHYNISYNNPHRHFIDFEFSTNTNGQKSMLLQLPAWRPGRYELANYAQNIQKWDAFNENGENLSFQKLTKDLWEVQTQNTNTITIRYTYYANQLDAGASYLDESQLYLNPVNCCYYIVGREQEEYHIKFDIPQNYIIACGLEKLDKHILKANCFDELAECPMIASNNIQHNSYEIGGVPFNIWMQGPCTPKWEVILKDFQAFTESQIKHFGDFPTKEYHFLFQITPYKSYHGVEHTNNTVILLGPADKINEDRYEELLGVSSHELYHSWNIKAIRPVEMYPYDYTKENYFRTGYVAEGVTTYMGDVMLYNSGVFDWDQFIKTQNQNLERHLMNYGRKNLSVADSGFDNWLDGYKLGIPNRKNSIYPDGALCMLMIDLHIIKNTNGQDSLHSVMKDMYEKFALQNKGYTEKDFRDICAHYGGNEIENIFNNHIYDTKDYIPSLKKALEFIGLTLEPKKNPNLSAQYFGFVAIKENSKIIIRLVEPNSVADQNNIAVGDEITLIDGKKRDGLKDYLKDCKDKVNFIIKKKFSEKEITLPISNCYKLLIFEKDENANQEQLSLRKKWLS